MVQRTLIGLAILGTGVVGGFAIAERLRAPICYSENECFDSISQAVCTVLDRRYDGAQRLRSEVLTQPPPPGVRDWAFSIQCERRL